MLFAHGFGCDQNMWRFVTPAFEATHRIVLFDHVGAGGSDLTAFDPDRYSAPARATPTTCWRSATRSTCTDVVFVGHSVSAMIGVLAANREPERFSRLVLVGPSPRYINDGEYVGGFTAEDIDGLLDSLDSNYLGWSSAMAPVIMGNPDRPQLGDELTNSFCRTDPEIARHFARVTFTSDNRADLADVRVPDAGPAVLGRRDRARRRSATTCTAQIAGSTLVRAGRHRALPQPQRTRGDGGSDRDLPGLPLTPTVTADEPADDDARRRAPRGQRGGPLRARAVRLPVLATPTAGSPG